MPVSFKPNSQEPWFRQWRLTFGKYRGTPLKDVDDGYLSYLMDGSANRDSKEGEAIALEWGWRGGRR
jgi:hypothetical protein